MTAKVFSALAHPTRVEIFMQLLATFPDGLNSKQIRTRVEITPTTLTHHLREMEQGGIIVRRPKGQSTITTLNLSPLTQIMSQMMGLCCSADPTLTTGEPS